MKKNLLIITCVFLGLTGQAFSAEAQNLTTETELEQKACQNVFSFINIDLSVMSPRATGADVNISDIKPAEQKNAAIVPIANKTEQKQEIQAQKSKTSLFRLDLLHIFKIQIF